MFSLLKLSAKLEIISLSTPTRGDVISLIKANDNSNSPSLPLYPKCRSFYCPTLRHCKFFPVPRLLVEARLIKEEVDVTSHPVYRQVLHACSSSVVRGKISCKKTREDLGLSREIPLVSHKESFFNLLAPKQRSIYQ